MSLVKVRCRSQSSVFFEGKDFEDVVRLAVSPGGDADTMASHSWLNRSLHLSDTGMDWQEMCGGFTCTAIKRIIAF